MHISPFLLTILAIGPSVTSIPLTTPGNDGLAAEAPASWSSRPSGWAKLVKALKVQERSILTSVSSSGSGSTTKSQLSSPQDKHRYNHGATGYSSGTTTNVNGYSSSNSIHSSSRPKAKTNAAYDGVAVGANNHGVGSTTTTSNDGVRQGETEHLMFPYMQPGTAASATSSAPYHKSSRPRPYPPASRPQGQGHHSSTVVAAGDNVNLKDKRGVILDLGLICLAIGPGCPDTSDTPTNGGGNDTPKNPPADDSDDEEEVAPKKTKSPKAKNPSSGDSSPGLDADISAHIKAEQAQEEEYRAEEKALADSIRQESVRLKSQSSSSSSQSHSKSGSSSFGAASIDDSPNSSQNSNEEKNLEWMAAKLEAAERHREQLAKSIADDEKKLKAAEAKAKGSSSNSKGGFTGQSVESKPKSKPKAKSASPSKTKGSAKVKSTSASSASAASSTKKAQSHRVD